MSAARLLNSLIKRLQPKVGAARPKDTLFYADTPSDRRAHRALAEVGHFNFETALWWARKALASGDPDQISAAAEFCPGLVFEGYEMKLRYATRRMRSKGGKARAQQQAEEADRRW